MRTVRLVMLTLAVGLGLLVVVVAFILSRSPPRVLITGAAPTSILAPLTGDGEACQPSEELPAGATAVRLSLVAFFGARIHVRAYSGSTLLTEGTRSAEWTGTSVTVPLKPLRHRASNVTLCVDIAPNSEAIYLFGSESSPARAMTVPQGGRLAGRLDVTYLAPGQVSWWARVLTVARHMGLGRAFSGTWIVLLIAGLVAGVGILAGRLTLRELS